MTTLESIIKKSTRFGLSALSSRKYGDFMAMFDQTLDDILGIYDKTKKKVIDMADKIYLLKPDKAPLYELVKKLKKKKSIKVEHKWIEDDLGGILAQQRNRPPEKKEMDLDDILGVQKKQPLCTTTTTTPNPYSQWAGAMSASAGLTAGNIVAVSSMNQHQQLGGVGGSGTCPVCGHTPNMTQIYQKSIKIKAPKMTLDEILDEEI